MNKDKFSKWLDAILHEDGHNLSGGSVTTIRLIKEELKKPLDESFSSSPDDESLSRLISMVCDQFGAGFAGREEFIAKTITEWRKSLPVGEPKQSVEEIWNSNSKTFDSGYHNTHIDYMDKETFVKLLREYSQSKDREIEELKERCISWAGKYDESQSEKEVANHELLKLQAELKYWRELAEAADKVFSTYKEWTEACKDKTHSAFSVSLMYKIYTQAKEKYQSLKN